MRRKTNTICSVIAFLVMIGLLVSVNEFSAQSSMLRTVLQLGSIYALAAVSMNLLNGFTGLFSLGQAGFMAIGAYAFAILTIPVHKKPSVYYLYGVSHILENVELPTWLALIVGGLIAALLAALIGAPILRLRSDYFAIATLGFSEIVRVLVASSPFNTITNGSLGLKMIPKFGSYYTPFVVTFICITIIALLIRSSYGRAFKAIREDEIAAEAMGINLATHKQISFVISSFFAGISGALLAMYLGAITSTTFPIMLTYNILLIVVIGGIGSITGSVISAFLVTAAKEWWLRFLDQPLILAGIQLPFFRTGFRMVVFSVILMLVVLFWRKGIMGQKELSWDGLYNFFSRRKRKTKRVRKSSRGVL